jgi:hypothetical protein
VQVIDGAGTASKLSGPSSETRSVPERFKFGKASSEPSTPKPMARTGAPSTSALEASAGAENGATVSFEARRRSAMSKLCVAAS